MSKRERVLGQGKEAIEKIKFMGKALIAFTGKGKIIFKKLGTDTHYTLDLLRGDLHETKEGQEKEHRPLGRIDWGNFDPDLAQKELSIFRQENAINPEDTSWKGTTVYIPKYRKGERPKLLSKFVEIKRKEAIVRETISNEEKCILAENYFIVPMTDVRKYDFSSAFVSKGEDILILFNVGGVYVLSTLENMIEFFKKILPISFRRRTN